MAEPIFYIERNVFAKSGDWISNKSDSINKPQADYFEASETSDGTMMVTNGSLKAWGGALVSRKRGVPAANGKKLNWLVFRLKFKFPKATGENTARLETDLKVCCKSRPNASTYIRNVSNFSMQWNADTGQFQIDKDPPQWTDSGFIVTSIEPDVWHTLEMRYWFDEVNLVFSYLSIQYDDQLYMIPESLQKVAMTSTNWEEVASLQLQTEVYAARSTVEVGYIEGTLCWSDQRIAMIPAEALEREEEEDSFWWPRLRDANQEIVGGTFDPFGPDASVLERAKSVVDLRE